MSKTRPGLRQALAAGRTIWTAGCYDALSARMIEAAGFEGVLTSGFGVSASFLGQGDAELYTMTENLTVVRNVVGAVKSAMVIADIDTGYGNAINVMRTIREFEATGIAGVIMEDQVSPKRCPVCADRVEVLPIPEAVAKFKAAVAARSNPDFIIMARTDAMNEGEAIQRAKAYVAAGADVIQPISRCFKNYEGLKALRQACGVPLSLQLLGWLEKELSPAQIESIAGVAHFPLVPVMTVAAALRQNLAVLASTRSSKGLPITPMGQHDFVDFIGFAEIEALQQQFLQQPDAAE